MLDRGRLAANINTRKVMSTESILDDIGRGLTAGRLV